MERAGRRLHKMVAMVNLGWAIWALLGGLFFLESQATIGPETTLSVFHKYVYGYEILGISLLVCGLISLFGVCITKLQKVAAILCAVWCLVTALFLQFATPEFDQGDIDAWLLLMCAFTCVMRWALLVLEPYVTK